MISYDPKRWIHVLLSFPRSPVFKTLFLDLVLVGLYAWFVVWIELEVMRISVPLGPQILSLLGIILGLVLVFRTNTAYDRWWEGRKLWGALVNTSRALARHLDGMLPASAADRRARYAALLAAYPPALARHLRTGGEGTPEERALVADLPPAQGLPHWPNRLAQAITRDLHADIAAGRLPREAIIALTPLVTALDDITGACERIRKTPIPLSYSSYIKQFVVLFALLIPFALAEEFRYGTVLAEMALFFSTMGIELLATEVEEPFGTDSNDLPLDEIAGNIGRDVRALLLP